MLNPIDLTEYIIRPVLKELATWRSGFHSEAAENLMLWTAMTESNLEYLHQLRGPAIGLWQVEPATHEATWHYISRYPEFASLVRSFSCEKYTMPEAEEMHGNLYYNCAIARIKYWTIPKPLPHFLDTAAMADYWGRFYNTKNLDHDKQRFVDLANLTLT